MLEIYNDEFFMKQALIEAQKAFDKNEVPVGAVVVSNNRIIARSHNLTEQLTDVTAHAEVQAITAASQFLGAKYLKGCTIYITLEPCSMCAGLLVHSRIKRVVYASADLKTGAAGSAFNLLCDEKHNHQIELDSGIMAEECSQLLSAFFKRRRAEKKVLKQKTTLAFKTNR